MLVQVSILLGWLSTLFLSAQSSPVLKKFVINQVPKFEHAETVRAGAKLLDTNGPSIQTGTLSADGSSCALVFNGPTNQAGFSSNFPCSQLFDFSGASFATCYWSDSKTVMILPDFSTPANIQAAVNVGTYVKLLDNNQLFNAGCSSNCQIAWGAIFIVGPTNPISPVVSIGTADFISNCVAWRLDLRSSSGDGQRGWQSFKVTVTGATQNAALQSAITNAFTTTSVMTIPSNLLNADNSFTLKIELCNAFSNCASASKQISVTSSGFSAPAVSISGATSANAIFTSTPLSLTAIASVTGCTGGSSSSGLTYAWQIMSGGVVDNSFKSTARAVSQFSLPAFSLTAGKTYTVGVTVTSQTSKLSTSESYTFTVQSSALVASISPSTMQLVRAGSSLTLSASKSYDPDDLTGEKGSLTYSWTCVGATSSCKVTLGAADQPSLTIATDQNAIDTLSIITLTVTKGTRSSTASIAVNVVEGQAPLITIKSTSDSVTQVNPSNALLISGQVQSSYQVDCTWSCDSASVDLSKALTPTTSTVPANAPTTLNLFLAGNALGVRAAYQFKLSCRNSVTTVVVTTNGPPVGGVFAVSPSTGVEMTDVFQFVTSQWSDPDLPITYMFGFISPTTGGFSTVQSRSVLAYAGSALPAGLQSSSFAVSTLVQAFDALNASVTSTSSVTVNVYQGDASQTITNQLTASKDSTNLDQVKSLISVASAVISRVDCSAATNCASLNRDSCLSTAGTCGPCLANFVGQPGDGNSKCVSAQDAAATTEQKKCPNSCSGNGVCTFYDTLSGLTTTSCSIVNSQCTASCVCSGTFTGSDCSLTPSQLASQQTLRSTLLTSLSSVVNNEDTTADSVTNVVSSLSGIVKTASDVNADAVNTFATIASTTLSNALDNPSVTSDMLAGFLGPADAAMDATAATSASNALDLGTQVLSAFSSVVSRDSVVGVGATQFVQNNFRLSQQTVSSDASSSVSLPQTDAEKAKGKPVTSITVAADSSTDGTPVTVQMVEYKSSLLTVNSPDSSKFSNVLSAQIGSAGPVTFKLANLAGTLGPQPPQHRQNFTTFCGEDDHKTYTYTCPRSGEVLSHRCTGLVGTKVSYCHYLTTVCGTVSLGDSSSNYNCAQIAMDADYITCQCTPNRRRLDGNVVGQTGVMNLVAMTEYVGGQAGETFKAAPALTNPAAIEKSLIVIIMFVVLWLGGMGMVAGCIYRQRKMHKERRERRLEEINRADRESKLSSVDDVRDKLISYVHSVFPIIFYSDHWLVRLKDEIRRNHSYMMLFNSVDGDLADKKRILNGLRLLTAQTCLMFLLAFLYDLQSPDDDGTCPGYTTQQNCLARKSILERSVSYCAWDNTDSSVAPCQFNQAPISFKASLYVQVIVSVFTSIMMRPLSYAFDVLLAPDVDNVKQRMGEDRANDPEKPEGTRHSIIFGKETEDAEMDELAEMLVTLIPDDIDMVHAQAKSYFRRLNNSYEPTEKNALENGTRNQQPARRSMIDRLKSSITEFARRKEGQENETVTRLMFELKEKIHAQRAMLSGEELEIFDKQWGLDGEGNFLTNVDMIKGKADIETIIEKEVRRVEHETSEDIQRLRVAVDNHLGLEILHKFILDILGRDTPAALIFSGKTEEDFKKTPVRTLRLKIVVSIFIFLANALFVYFSVLKGFVKGVAWQKSYLVACIIQMVLEIYLFETMECIWINVFVPSIVHPEVQRVNHLLLDIINDICNKAVHGQKITDGNDKRLLDSPDYLFMSNRLARAFPNLMESMIVRAYHNHLPGEISQKWLGEQKVYARNYFGINHGQRDTWSLMIASVLSMVATMNLIAFVPFDVQKMVVRFFQPFLFGGLVLLWQKIVSSIVGIVVAIIVIAAIVFAVFFHYYYHKANSEDETDKFGKVMPVQEGFPYETLATKSSDSMKKTGKVIPMNGNKREISINSNGVTEESCSIRDPHIVNELEMTDYLHQPKKKSTHKSKAKKVAKEEDKDDSDNDSYLLSLSDPDQDDLSLDEYRLD